MAGGSDRFVTSERWVSPLAEIEHAVQQRAKDVDLDVASDDGVDKLRALIGEEIDRWNEDHARGRHARAIAEPHRIAERALRNIAGYGPLVPLLEDDDVWEVMQAAAPTWPFHHSRRSGQPSVLPTSTRR